MTENRQKHKFIFAEIFPTEACDRSDRLYGYFQGLLSEDDQEEFEKHLSTCFVCAKLLTELEESKLAGEKTVLDAGQADSIFRENRVKIEDQLNRKFRIQQRPIPIVDRFRFPAYINIMMLVAVAILIYPSYRSFVLNQQVSQLQTELAVEKNRKPVEVAVPEAIGPAVSPSSVYPVRNERDAEQKTIRIRFSETEKNFTLVFPVPSEEFEGYLFEVSRNGQPVWQSKTPVQSNLISLNLHANDFPSGTYNLTVYGVIGTQKSPLTTYKLQIS